MIPKLVLDFEPAAAPIAELVTKFGGQPVWNGPPAWPIHSDTGQPMEFVAQIRLEPELFSAPQTTMAYLFVADAVEALTYDPYESGNAVVLQPGAPARVTTALEAEGPTLHHLVSDIGAPLSAPAERCEFVGVLTPDWDADPGDSQLVAQSAGDPWAEYQARATGILGTRRGHKVGGDPFFHRGWPEPFTPEEWRLLLQLDGDLPFFLNLGLDGTGYVLVRTDLSEGVFFWERPG